jgi:hypothetical protein
MKLAENQIYTIYNLIKSELDSDDQKSIRDAKIHNKKIELDAFNKFVKTKEYSALLLLKSSFKELGFGKIVTVDNIQLLANKKFDVKKHTQREYSYYYNVKKDIVLLAIDCKNLSELFDSIHKYYHLKKKPSMPKYDKPKTK